MSGFWRGGDDDSYNGGWWWVGICGLRCRCIAGDWRGTG